ncbi:hypothetical protein BKA67DRAFT_538292 [Truncatella angustata]|uniref:Uncharacterized protein n=1 Tax=Truncatella angustata TaxID=152316 RepID=A0A9P8UE40_9PEZI|nr:uncharacterized protein BKA67DRAFT_538292 [Truncatella angustata]KAH6648239.1 hypothetical protein BKA67DRAFT_538292 [Truncatella angustata]
MGGLAFTKGPTPLHTPRMPRVIYEHVRDNCHTLLRELFVVVTTPIEGPGKSDFGDIDIFVTMGKHEYFGDSFTPRMPGFQQGGTPFEAIQALLGAERKIQERDSVAMFAIPWPKILPYGIADVADAEGDQPRFIQVDVHICPSLQNLEWFLFKHAHGDLWNLLGSTIRPYGLTVDEVGMYLRIPEIENVNRNKAKILLTSDPCQVLDFLGLKYEGSAWEVSFANMEEVFEYAATSRFFWVKPHTEDDDIAAHGGNQEVGGGYRGKNLKSNDRQRMRQRPLFRKWIEEFLPKCQDQNRFANRGLSREDTREEAFRQFGVRRVYEDRILEFRKQRQRESLWRDVIKTAIPTDIQPQFRGCVASAMKKIIMEDDTSFGVRPETPLKDESGLYLEDTVRHFVKGNWKEVGRVAWETNQIRLQESVAAKGNKPTFSGNEKGNLKDELLE